MAIRVRHGAKGTRYAVIFRDVGVQHSATFDTPEEAEGYQREATARVVAQCRCLPRPRRLRMARATLNQGRILCGTCGQPFTETSG